MQQLKTLFIHTTILLAPVPDSQVLIIWPAVKCFSQIEVLGLTLRLERGIAFIHLDFSSSSFGNKKQETFSGFDLYPDLQYTTQHIDGMTTINKKHKNNEVTRHTMINRTRKIDRFYKIMHYADSNSLPRL